MSIVKISIPGLGGCELRTPMVGDLSEHIGLMSSDAQAFLLKAIGVSVYCNNERVEDVLNKLPFDMLTDVTGHMADLLGFSDTDEPGND